MKIDYRVIRTTSEKIRLYRFRKQVFVDEEQRFSIVSDHITDLFDSIDETVNIAAFNDNKIIAALRITPDSDAGFPADLHWDFSDIRSRLTPPCVNFGWLCCAKAFRHHKSLIKTLVARGAGQAKKMGARHILSVIHPPAFTLFNQCFGTRKIGDPFLEPHLNTKMIPTHTLVDEILIRHPDAVVSGGRPCGADILGTKVFEKEPGVRLQGLQNLGGKFHFLEQALSRNLGILSPADQERLLNAHIAIPGLGGVGGQHLITLARTGIGKFTVADFDRFETKNINRQYGARLSTLDRPKTDVMVEDCLDINPFLDIRQFPGGVTPDNIDEFLDGVDLVADGMDFFNIDIRRLIFSRAREKKIPVITAGPLGFSTALLIFMPDRGMGFDRYFNISDDLDREEQLIRFFVGLAPKATQAAYISPATISMAGGRGPSTGAGCLICSSVLTAESVRILLNKKGIKCAPHYFQYDPFTRQFHQGYLLLGNRNLAQRLKIRVVAKKLKTALPLDIPPAPAHSPGTSLSDTIIPYLISAGCQAPSGDNCQPWKFTHKQTTINLDLDPDADTSFFNFDQMASHIACGAAIENICLAATRYHLSTRIDYCPEQEQPGFLARITLEPARIEESDLARFIWTRHTNRTDFNGNPVPDTDVEKIFNSLEDFPGARLVLVRDKRRIREISRLIYEVDTIRSQRKDLHTHLMKMIRFTTDQALMTRDGLPLKNLEAGMAGETILKLCRPWPVMHLANKAGLGRMVARTAARWARQSSAIGLLTIQGQGISPRLLGGRAMERLWLTTTCLGLSFQPMTAAALFREQWKAGVKGRFSMTHQQRLGKIWPLYDHHFKTDPEETQIMLFRLGFGGHVSCRTLRRYQAMQN